MSLTKLSLARKSFVSDILAGARKIDNLFYSVRHKVPEICTLLSHIILNYKHQTIAVLCMEPIILNFRLLHNCKYSLKIC